MLLSFQENTIILLLLFLGRKTFLSLKDIGNFFFLFHHNANRCWYFFFWLIQNATRRWYLRSNSINIIYRISLGIFIKFLKNAGRANNLLNAVPPLENLWCASYCFPNPRCCHSVLLSVTSWYDVTMFPWALPFSNVWKSFSLEYEMELETEEVKMKHQNVILSVWAGVGSF